MGSDHVVGPLFVHPSRGYGAKRPFGRSPAYPCPSGPLYGSRNVELSKLYTGLMVINDPLPGWGLGATT